MDSAGLDLDAAFDATRRAVADLGFRVEPSVDLAVLQFAKFRLWKDLDDNWGSAWVCSPAQRRRIRRAIRRRRGRHGGRRPGDLEPTDPDAGALDPSDGDDTVPGLGLDGFANRSGPGTQQSFDDAVRGLVERCRAELQYDPKYFKIMIAQHGSLGAVRRLLMAPGVSDGFVKLWERQRLDLAAESLVVDERYRHLFTPKELNIAHTRLANFSEGVSSRSA